MEEKLLSSLQRILISARAGDMCGMLMWCWFGWTLTPASQHSPDVITLSRQQLVYLALAELTGASGKSFVDLVKMHRDYTCHDVRQNGSLMSCLIDN